jgi:hypothetical protein
VCLQDGLKLDLNQLARRGFITPGEQSGRIGILWISTYWDKQIAAGDSAQGFGFTYAFTAAGFASAVPEPSTWAMMLLGFAGLGFAAYRSRQRIAPEKVASPARR